jgi:hypothetical protein
MEGNKGLGNYEGKGKNDIMVMWGCLFILVTFKTLGLFNLFLSNTQNIQE